jgi:hypothetical protein
LSALEIVSFADKSVEGGAPGEGARTYENSAAAFVLFVTFGLAAVGAAITTTKYVTTNQAAISGKEHRIPTRPSG